MPIYYTKDKNGKTQYYKYGRKISKDAIGDKPVFKMKTKCKKGYVLNEKTNTCVLETSRTGRKIIEQTRKERRERPVGTVYNPASGKYVSKDGKVGKQIKEIRKVRTARWFVFTRPGCPYCADAKTVEKQGANICAFFGNGRKPRSGLSAYR